MHPGDNNKASQSDTEELRKFRDTWKHELHAQRDRGPDLHAGHERTLEKEKINPTTQQHTYKPRILHAPVDKGSQNTLIFAFSELLLNEPPDNPTTGHILSLPLELQLHVACFLDNTTLEVVSEVCRSWYILARDESLPQYPELCFTTWPLTGPAEFQLYGFNWRSMFLHRPRIRSDGVYISKNQYVRPGATEGSYYQPIHEVIYYRYLRFFSNGQVLAALTSEAPKQVIQWLRLPQQSISGEPVHQKKDVQTGTYVAEEGEITVWQPMPFYTLCLKLQLTSTKQGRNDRLSMLAYSCLSNGNMCELDDMVVRRFQFAKLPKPFLAMEQQQQQEQIIV